MPTQAVIAIETRLGTAQLIVDATKAKAIIRDFGQSTRSSMVASSAALRELEGNFANNNRAIARFLADTLKLGPVLQAAFPVLGGIAFGTMLVELGGKAYKFFKDMELAPLKISNSFQVMNSAIRSSDDTTRVSIDKIENQIAKLLGKRENNLKLALDEAAEASDKLTASLAKNVDELYKLLSKDKPGGLEEALNPSNWKAALQGLVRPGLLGGIGGAVSSVAGKLGSDDLSKYFGGEEGEGGMSAQINKIRASSETYIDAIRNNAKLTQQERLDAEHKAIIATNSLLLEQYQDAQDFLTKALVGADTKAQRERIAGARIALQRMTTDANDQIRLASVTQQKNALEINAENSKDRDRPFENRIAEMEAALVGAKAKLAAVGQDEAFQVQARAAEVAVKAITDVNDAMKRLHEADKASPASLSVDQEQRAINLALDKAAVDSQTEWKTRLKETTDRIHDQTRSQELLTAAIGKGYEAVKRAAVETELMKNHKEYNDLLQNHPEELEKLRVASSAQYDAQSAEQSARAVHTLEDQIELEKALAKVQIDGAAAVRYMTLQVELRQKANGDVKASEEELGKIREKFAAEQTNATAKDLATIQERTRAIERLIAAQLHGAEAVRQAELENKYDDMRRKGGTPIPVGPLGVSLAGPTQEEQAERGKDALDKYHEIEVSVGKRLSLYNDELAALSQEKALLLDQIGDQKASVDQTRALKELNDEILKAQIAYNLAQGTAKAGLIAFFEEMQKQAKQASEILYEALNSALDKTSDQLSKLLTGKKTQFGKMLDEIGTSILREAIKSGLQQGLGKLGGVLDPKGAAQRKADQAEKQAQLRLQQQVAKRDLLRPIGTQGDPVYIRDADSSQDSSAGGIPLPSGTSGAKTGNLLQGIGNGITGIIGAFGSISQGAAPSSSGGSTGSSPQGTASSTITYGGVVPDTPSGGGDADFGGGMAAGGYMSAGKTYLVGEHGPELVRGSNMRIHSNAETRQILGGGGNVTNNNIDARGADLGASSRIRRGLEATHASSVATSQKMAAENRKRTPQRA